MLTPVDLRGVAADELARHLPRPEVAGEGPVAAVREILDDVRVRGDEALRDLTERFDGVRPEQLRVPVEELHAALHRIDPDVRRALEIAAERIRAFHETQVRPDHELRRDGLVVEALVRPVDRAGIYVPGGRAAYPSTVLMAAIPALVAGVEQVALVVPPNRDTGRVADVTLAAAAIAGVDEVYGIGGAQAIGALAYGTATIRPVDVIAGPGNVYVAVAKREVADHVGIAAAFAGPSEVVVVADGSTPVDYAAIDVVLQAEHGPDGLSWLITWSDDVARDVDAAIERLVASAPRRADIEATLDKGGYVALVDGPEQAIDVANLIAPEHLELLCADPRSLVPRVRHAGAVFCGPLAPASIGDYLAGPSHVLPTDGTARFASALTVADFTKDVHVVTVDPEGFDAVAPHVVAIAEAEGLDAHAESIRLRQADR
ncbi:histidinol dehydrogenase [Actinomarinicola tropica]|uniref:Histidinol dehydrogenase n=1 Tax=Actinomarinicola tropica TaxID=2789776 RepID=A0A5Q2RKR3_9ACTN|nr:histidinol dehydrogenase [Actinomarinicola tropica]QGG95512.1 histidinol dehydrogenase [Actinomarinicola tropica]